LHTGHGGAYSRIVEKCSEWEHLLFNDDTARRGGERGGERGAGRSHLALAAPAGGPRRASAGRRIPGM